jgi:excisionase family DNA binding protein
MRGSGFMSAKLSNSPCPLHSPIKSDRKAVTVAQLHETDLVDAIADAVAARLRPMVLPPGWPEGRGTLSEPETAAYLGIGQDFLRELRQAGRISHTAQGRRVTYSVRDVVEYLERCRRIGSDDDTRQAN